MYYVFNIYMYYKRNIGGLWLHPGPVLLEKVFRPARDILKEIDPQTDFLHMWFIYIFFTDNVLFYSWFLTSRNSKLVGYVFILFIHWVRGLLTLSFPLFLR